MIIISFATVILFIRLLIKKSILITIVDYLVIDILPALTVHNLTIHLVRISEKGPFQTLSFAKARLENVGTEQLYQFR